MTEREALIRVCRESVGPLYEFVSRRVGGRRDLAEDVTQEAFLRSLVRWRTRGLPREPLAWLTTVARNLLIDHHRRAAPVPVDPALLRDTIARDGRDSPDAAAILFWGLTRLRRGQARILEAFHFDGRSVREIARDLGVSEKAAEGRLARARAALRKRLRRYLDENGGVR